MTLEAPKSEAIASAAVELFKKLHALDRQIERLKDAHTIKVEHWANGATGNYPITTRIEGEYVDPIRSVALAYLAAERQKIVEQLARYGFAE